MVRGKSDTGFLQEKLIPVNTRIAFHIDPKTFFAYNAINKGGMKVNTIITGSWYPRTRFHLQEYYDFLLDGTALEELNKKEVKKAQRRLSPSDVTYIGLSEGGRFDSVTADLHGFSSTYFEDGLLLLSREVTDIDKDYKQIHKFFTEKVTTGLRLIYSVGVPSITFRKRREHAHTTIVLSSRVSEKQAAEFMSDHDDEISFIAKNKGHKVYFGKKHIVIETKSSSSIVTRKVISSIIFFREFENRLNKFLNLHRKVWSGIQDIREKKRIRLKDLPEIRDSLLDHQRDLAIVRARLGQMSDYLTERRKEIDEFGFADHLRKLEAYRFGKMQMNAAYMRRLWNMLEDYIGSTLKIIDLMYQDNIQKQLNVQQFIFLVGAIAGVVGLGKLADSQLVITTSTGGLGYTGALLLFGSLAIAISVTIFIAVKIVIPALMGLRIKQAFREKKLFKEEKSE